MKRCRDPPWDKWADLPLIAKENPPTPVGIGGKQEEEPVPTKSQPKEKSMMNLNTFQKKEVNHILFSALISLVGVIATTAAQLIVSVGNLETNGVQSHRRSRPRARGRVANGRTVKKVKLPKVKDPLDIK